MSLVTTAMSIWSRSAWHRASVSAVLPEPTGPPMPTRSAAALVLRRLAVEAHDLKSLVSIGFRGGQQAMAKAGEKLDHSAFGRSSAR